MLQVEKESIAPSPELLSEGIAAVKLEKKKDDQPKDQLENEPSQNVAPEEGEKKKKKKKKKKHSKKKNITIITQYYPNEIYPEGEWSDYKQDLELDDNLKRSTNQEKKQLDLINFNKWNDLRKGAEIHRRSRKLARNLIKPGMTMIEIADTIENAVRTFSGGDKLNEKITGMGFPTGLSLNHVAAHYTPNAGDKTILHEDDVMKVDIGVHVNGNIVDCAFTHTFNPKYDPLLTAVREATYTGIKEAGVDVRLTDIGEAVQEVMESYEIELDNRVYPIKCIRNLNGHNIAPFQIHGGKTVPIVKNGDNTKMEENEVFAIETFGSTGRGYVISQGECSHYSRIPDSEISNGYPPTLKLNKAKELLSTIDSHFGTLPFCRRYLDRTGEQKYLLALRNLVQSGYVRDYLPLVDTKGSYTAQFEHTIIIHPTRKEIVSKGDDF
ncbi:methionine aminopeptidase [Ascoidea rubescens DSM 1968]|uniref:Methionine aminopeptidase 2 n=1 Tax=Ascoidea rubescens DSM 1968 TaxID=1344418 RepID=A0A1D2VP90_9ASCO|nr:methionine aminopeptidase 2 [Ascoidea rubescens DSM 1968]ODV63416.1 methionine aminopeptidase 2 [Ascoidea rubescens DSM 1968]